MSLGVALVVLTTLEEAQAPEAARALLARSRQKSVEPATSRAIMELITMIMVYKFTNLSRQEIEAMLGINLQQTRVYQEAKEEGQQETLQQVVLNLLKEGTSLEAITRITGLSIEQVEQLQNIAPQNPQT